MPASVATERRDASGQKETLPSKAAVTTPMGPPSKQAIAKL